MKRQFLALSLVSIAAVTFSGCATTDSNSKPPPPRSDKERVSNLPWNRPQSWEGGGTLGGMGLGR
jgi:outer membrane lipoprotein SlyB